MSDVSLTEVPVLVTGASGFIGGRLAERLAAEDKASVVGAGRSFSEEARLRDAGVTIHRADVRDAGAMERLCEGKRVVFHLAAWVERGKGGEADAYAVNVDATRALVTAAARAGCERFVLVSTISAYGLPSTDHIDESVPIDVAQADLYGRTKALGEEAAREAAAKTNLAISIVRPAMVYGPRSGGWTVGMLRLVQKGVPVIFGNGQGYAYPVYVDDVVDMVRLAATRPEARGEAFNASDAAITWERFFSFYGAMSGKRPRRVPMPIAYLIARANELLKLGIPLTAERLERYVRKLQYPTEKAERLLGWQVRVPLDEGMRRSEAWLRETGKLNQT
ncbi:NAD-dependent epimerase/dehydratase family protein [Polyangium jinanense]|uniref:NAD-dependent epimerase/dehydratase family protein n=1 Tax=Polyangium jinanense TaxID=2829994 RepID=A0A9X4AVG4_9BACT|nr:NAD-dependent epimerase/dehydratase family protein [Polyangium jinanense]MDC3960025.1 NAD-dependent epimerase/dehydratase family protein [Polyangium jinanense]MDC3986243.1 NAD-dependent epimerase/dehydratase family protein [Polyangium jinanense]